MTFKPTYDNLLRMRALSARGIRTVDIPCHDPSTAARDCGEKIPLVTYEIPTARINVEAWLDAHDPWRRRGPQ